MSQEEQDLATHVEICSLRYKGIEDKFNVINHRLNKVETDISAIKEQMHTGFSEIKILLEKQSNSRTIQLIATLGTVAVAIISSLAIWLTR